MTLFVQICKDLMFATVVLLFGSFYLTKLNIVFVTVLCKSLLNRMLLAGGYFGDGLIYCLILGYSKLRPITKSEAETKGNYGKLAVLFNF